MAARIRSWLNADHATDVDEQSRDDLSFAGAGDNVYVSSIDAASTYAWTIVFAPEGSGATFSLSSADPSPGFFNCDEPGAYLIRLVVDAGQPTESTQYVRLRALTTVAALKLVAAGERRDTSGIIPVDVDVEGWANEQNYNLTQLEQLIPIGTVESVASTFQWNSASPVQVTNLIAADAVLELWLKFDTAFLDAASTVSVGTDLDLEKYLPIVDVDVTNTVYTLAYSPGDVLTANQSLQVSVIPGGAETQGSGTLLALIRRG